MTIDLAGLWDSGLFLFYLSLALVIVLDVAVMLWASGAVSRKASHEKSAPASRAEAPAAPLQPVDDAADQSPSLPSRVLERRRLEDAQPTHLVRVGEVPVGL